MKSILSAALVLCISYCYGQYNYGLEVEQQDAKIEGRLHLYSGNDDLYIGKDAGGSVQAGQNIAIGHDAAINHDWGNANTLLGFNVADVGESLTRNVLIGSYTGGAALTLADNVYLGTAAGSCTGCTSFQERNIFIGSSAGLSGNAANNIILGYQAGRQLRDSNSDNLLIIENNNDTDLNTKHLIFGEFDNRKVGINWESGNNLTAYPNLPATLSVNGTLHVSETAKLEPQMSAPSTCTTTAEYGLMYYDRSVLPSKLKLCTETGWNDLN